MGLGMAGLRRSSIREGELVHGLRDVSDPSVKGVMLMGEKMKRSIAKMR